MSAVLEAVQLTERRRVQLDEILRETRLFSRRAEIPEDRIALAEIERELMDLMERWYAEGKLNGQSALPLIETGNGKAQTGKRNGQ